MKTLIHIKYTTLNEYEATTELNAILAGFHEPTVEHEYSSQRHESEVDITVNDFTEEHKRHLLTLLVEHQSIFELQVQCCVCAEFHDLRETHQCPPEKQCENCGRAFRHRRVEVVKCLACSMLVNRSDRLAAAMLIKTFG